MSLVPLVHWQLVLIFTLSASEADLTLCLVETEPLLINVDRLTHGIKLASLFIQAGVNEIDLSNLMTGLENRLHLAIKLLKDTWF